MRHAALTSVLLFISVLLVVGLIAMFSDVLRITPRTLHKVWADYEVKILDSSKVVLYRSDDVTDSLVFRCNANIFIGTEVVEKLEHVLK